MFASANRMLCRVLNRQWVSVACVVFLSVRTNEGSGSGRGIHYQQGAEFNKMAETTACRRLSHGERNIKLRNRRRFLRGKGLFFCARKVGFDVSILICVRCAVFFVECGFLPFVALHSLASIRHLKDCGLCVWKSGKDARKLTINNKFHVKHSDGWRSFT